MAATESTGKKTEVKQQSSGKKTGSEGQPRFEQNLLSFEDGVIRLGDEKLPGIMTSISVNGAVRFDEAKSDGLSGKKKTAIGFEDAEISISLNLLSDDESDCYHKLALIQGKFQNLDIAAKPQIYKVFSRQMQARNVETVIFSRLASSEDDGDDMIAVSLEFKEYNPPVIRRETNVLASKADQAKQAASAKDGDKSIQERIRFDLSSGTSSEVTEPK
jgi:hypothetical protein